jgi:hypothetical protein
VRTLSATASTVVTVRAVGFRARRRENLLRFDLDAGAVGSRSVDLIDWPQDATAETTTPDPACQPHEAAEDHRNAKSCDNDRCKRLHTSTVSLPGPCTGARSPAR